MLSQNQIKFLLVILMVSIWAENLELSTIIAAIVLLANIKRKISVKSLKYISLLGILLVIGSLSLFKFNVKPYDFIKDFTYFLRPIIVFLATYFSAINLKGKDVFFKILIYTGFGFAIIHLLNIAIHIGDFNISLERLRGVFGRTSHLELVALYLAITSKSFFIKHKLNKSVYNFLVVLLFISFCLYFSRTLYLVLFVMIIAHYGYLKLNFKGAIAIVFLALFSIGSIFYLNNYEEPKEPTFISGFVGKLKNSLDEAFNPVKFNVKAGDKRELWKFWRAYEAQKVVEKIDNEKAWIQGSGFGSKVDVGFELILNKEKIRELPTVHNGIAYVYMKIGILGTLIYTLSIFYLYMFYFSKSKNKLDEKYNRALVSTSMYILISSIFITGIFVPYDMATFLLGGVFALKALLNSNQVLD